MTFTPEKRSGDFKIEKTEHFKTLAKHWEHTSAIADHIKATGHGIKWDHFEIRAYGKTDYQSKKKEILFIQELNPILNTNPTSNKLSLYLCHYYFKSHSDLSLFLLYLNSFSKNNGYFWKCMLQHTKRQVELYEMHCFTINS